jgi:hypothetical protein
VPAASNSASEESGTDVGSSGKKRTTMAKLNRESKLRDKRAEKQARKAARKLAAGSDAGQPVTAASREDGQ